MAISLFFSDDSRQHNPSRQGMHNLIATGVIRVSSNYVRELIEVINELCKESGFPPGEEFKWSPGRDLWMHDNLIGIERQNFFTNICESLQQKDVIAAIVIEDTHYKRATNAQSNEMDVTNLLIERIEHQCKRTNFKSLIISDRPGGSRQDEDKFLSDCLETLQSGTEYVIPQHIIHNVLSTSSHLSRLIQVADLITGCTLSYVSGESVYSPPIFNLIHNVLDGESGRIGGVGLKLHPDYRFMNLYHWFLGDTFYRKGESDTHLPNTKLPYHDSPDMP